MTVNPAELFATEIARENGWHGPVTRVLDTEFPQCFPCYVITPGLVVYEDEPDCVVSVENRPGRFISAVSQAL